MFLASCFLFKRGGQPFRFCVKAASCRWNLFFLFSASLLISAWQQEIVFCTFDYLLNSSLMLCFFFWIYAFFHRDGPLNTLNFPANKDGCTVRMLKPIDSQGRSLFFKMEYGVMNSWIRKTKTYAVVQASKLFVYALI